MWLVGGVGLFLIWVDVFVREIWCGVGIWGSFSLFLSFGVF